MGKARSLKSALRQLGDFIRSLPDAEDAPTDAAMELMFTFEGRGLSLNGSEASEYRACLQELYSALSRPELITKKELEKLLQRAIISALTFGEGSQLTVHPPQLSGAIRDLEAALTAAPQKFGVYHPVVGLEKDGLPLEVGLYRFLIFDDAEFDKFSTTMDDDDNPRRLAHRKRLQEEFDAEDLIGARLAYREVEALEPYAARDRAVGDLQTTLDVINFYSDLLPYNWAHLSLPGDRDGASITVPIRHLDTESRCTVVGRRVGRLGEMSLKSLFEIAESKGLGFERVNELLKSRPNRMADVFLASVRWAGRATASDRNETAFLLYVIALESLILADQDPRELSYRLRLRVAQLLGEDLEARREIGKRVSDLYSIRSKIVHSGHYEVSDADLSLIRRVVKTCIIKLSNDAEFWSLHTPDEFGKWIENKILE